MKGALVLLCCLGLALWARPAGAAPVPLDKLERIVVAGRQYVRVADWARAHRLTVTWPQPGRTLRVSNGAGSVQLTHDSRNAVINGISVALSFPAVVRQDRAYVALLDLKTAIVPLLYPAIVSAPVRVIAIDPGHGGKDKGYLQHSAFEKNCTLLLAQELGNQLTRAGFKAALTRSKDEYIDLSARPARANARRADLFVSLHFNSAGEGNRQVQGVETYCVTPVGASSSNANGAGADHGPVPGNVANDRSVLLAWHLQKALVSRLGLEDRGVKRARFEVLCQATMPAVLIEGGFLSNPAESRRILDPAFRKQMAQAIVQGIQSYQRAVTPTERAVASGGRNRSRR